jgi:hypothetical protein
MTDDRIATLRKALTEQEDDTDFQLRERLRAEASLAATKDALRQALTTAASMGAALDRLRGLHLPVRVPGIGGTSIGPFVRCSCTPGLLYDECPTAKALAGVSR